MSYGRFTKVAELAYGRELARLQYANQTGFSKHSEFSDYVVPIGAAGALGAGAGLAANTDLGRALTVGVVDDYKELRRRGLGRNQAARSVISPDSIRYGRWAEKGYRDALHRANSSVDDAGLLYRKGGKNRLARVLQGGRGRILGGAAGLAALTGAGLGARHLFSD